MDMSTWPSHLGRDKGRAKTDLDTLRMRADHPAATDRDSTGLSEEGPTMIRARRSVGPLSCAVLLLASYAALQIGPAHAAGPDGQLTWAVHTTLVPAWFDPIDLPGVITPYMVLYALHDAVVKPMPGRVMTPSLAESWSMSADGLVYEFVVRKGV